MRKLGRRRYRCFVTFAFHFFESVPMKKILIASSLIAVATSFSAHAEGPYIGANIGSAKQKININGQSSSDSRTGEKIYGGVELDKTFGVEAGYVNFGNTNKSFSDGVNTSSYGVKSSAVYLAGTATAPINDRFSVFGKLGVTANRSKINSTFNGVSSNNTRTHTDALIGVGASYAITKELAAVVEYENFGKLARGNGTDIKGDLVSVGMRYHF